MKKLITNKWTTFTLAMMCVVLGACLIGKAQTAQATAPVEQEPIIKYVEVIKEENFDTSIIEAQWCGGFYDGTIRMVGAWWYADGVVEDEQGQLWGIEQNIEETDFLLLWIADNHTPDNTVDDIIIKVWREAY
jgi:hypothetical protein